MNSINWKATRIMLHARYRRAPLISDAAADVTTNNVTRHLARRKRRVTNDTVKSSSDNKSLRISTEDLMKEEASNMNVVECTREGASMSRAFPRG